MIRMVAFVFLRSLGTSSWSPSYTAEPVWWSFRFRGGIVCMYSQIAIPIWISRIDLYDILRYDDSSIFQRKYENIRANVQGVFIIFECGQVAMSTVRLA